MRNAPRGDVPDSVLAGTIEGGARALGVPLDPGQLNRLVAHIRLIERWNATYNLTSVRAPQTMATHHILDCLAAVAALRRRREPVRRRRVLDVGSGAGLPGLVIAVVLPETEVVCVDTVGKKAAFITQAAAALGAGNVTSTHGRVERLAGRFDVIASRAFASLQDFVATTRHLLADNGEWMAMKGKVPTDEIASLHGVEASVEPLTVPGVAAERCVVWASLLHK